MKKFLIGLMLIIAVVFVTCADRDEGTPDKKTYTVSFDANGGIGGQIEDVTVTYGSPMPTLTASAPTLANKEFTGYFDAQTGGKKYYSIDLTSARNWDKTSDATLYAQYADEANITADNSSIVSLVKAPSTITNASQFTYAEIKTMVDEAIALAGGLTGIVKSGDTVILKPNIICAFYNWTHTGNAVTSAENATAAADPNGQCTDWRVVQAVAENVREIVGAGGKIIVLESSGKGPRDGTKTGTEYHYEALNYTAANLTAVDEIRTLDKVGGNFWNSTAQFTGEPPTDIKKVKLNNPVFNTPWTTVDSWDTTSDNVQSYDGQGNYHVVKEMYEADVLINIPVLKLHKYASGTTGGIKNISIGATPPRLFGRVSGDDIGRNDRIPHTTPNGLEKWIADYYAAMPADFTVMEALQAIDGGPIVDNFMQVGNMKKNMRAMLASKDGLAIDTVQTLILKLDHTKVLHLVYLTERGSVGLADRRVKTVRGNPKDITVVGNVKVGDIRDGVDFPASVAGGNPMIGTNRLSTADMAKPEITITKAQFASNRLDLFLNVSEDTVKVDIYIDNKYLRSVNTDLNHIIVDATSITAGERSIKVEAYTKYMAYEAATIKATK